MIWKFYRLSILQKALKDQNCTQGKNQFNFTCIENDMACVYLKTKIGFEVIFEVKQLVLSRVAQVHKVNFKYEKFISALADSYSFGK